MRTLVSIALLTGLVGCVPPPPVQIVTAPEPTAQEIAHSRQTQSRVIRAELDQVLAKAPEILLDNGFLIRSFNERSGVVCFYQQRFDGRQQRSISVEGTGILRSAGPGSTSIRLLLMGNWEGTAVGGGAKSVVISSVGGVQDPEFDEYGKILDMLEKGMGSGPAPR